MERQFFDPKKFKFVGAGYNPKRDKKRLTGLNLTVFRLMEDNRWRSLRKISNKTGHPEASVSAALRNLRKEQFGKHTVNRRYVENGLYVYQLKVNRKL